MKKSFLVLITFVIFSPPVTAQIYKWVDEDGVTHFSEKPRGSSDDSYSVNPDNQQQTSNQQQVGNNETIMPTPDWNKQQQINHKEGVTKTPEQRWPDCHSELCEKVKKIDINCTSQDCTDAVRFTNDCNSILCLGDRIDFEKKIDEKIQSILEKNKEINTPETTEDKQTKPTEEELLEKCNERKDPNCRKTLENYEKLFKKNKDGKKADKQQLRKFKQLQKRLEK